MSGMTGVDFLSAVRSDPKTKDIPFIIVTSPGSDEVQKIEAAVGARVDAYVVKPFRGEILNTKIAEVLAKKSANAIPRGGVLVVDDDDQARKIIIEIVELLGHSPIFEATDGQEGFDLLKQHVDEIGLVMSDWDMPKLSGNKLLRKIRSDPETAQDSLHHGHLTDVDRANEAHGGDQRAGEPLFDEAVHHQGPRSQNQHGAGQGWRCRGSQTDSSRKPKKPFKPDGCLRRARSIAKR